MLIAGGPVTITPFLIVEKACDHSFTTNARNPGLNRAFDRYKFMLY